MDLNLSKPIAFFDLETTGTNIARDRIVEISILKINTDQSQTIYTKKVNPGIPIPLETSMIHGIFDKDVADQPRFKELGAEVANFIGNADLGGFNVIRFDFPLLVEEFLRAGIDFDFKSRRVVDVQNIFHKMEPRNLVAAYKYYCDKDLVDAHSAEADTIATFEVLKAQLVKYQDREYVDRDGVIDKPVKNDIDSLHSFSQFTNNADLMGNIIYNDQGEELINFGKYKGQKVESVLQKAPGYYDWVMKSDFPLTTKKILTIIKLRGFNKDSSNIKF